MVQKQAVSFINKMSIVIAGKSIWYKQHHALHVILLYENNTFYVGITYFFYGMDYFHTTAQPVLFFLFFLKSYSEE